MPAAALAPGMEAEDTVVVDRPREAVFEFMDVPENQARVSPRLAASRTVGTLDNGGKRAAYTYRLFGLTYEGEVRGVEHDPPAYVRFVVDGDIEGEIEWAFEAVEGGTRVTYAIDYDLGLPPLVGRLLGPVVARVNRREMERTLENLRERV